jgi:hypothetical protein
VKKSLSKPDPFLKKAVEAIPENVAFVADVCRRAWRARDPRPVLVLVVSLLSLALIWILVNYGEGYLQGLPVRNGTPEVEAPEPVLVAQPVSKAIEAPKTISPPADPNPRPSSSEVQQKRQAVVRNRAVDDIAEPSPRFTVDVSYREECGSEFEPVSGLRDAIANKFMRPIEAFGNGVHVAVVAGVKSDTQQGLGTAMVGVGRYKVCRQPVDAGACQIDALSCSRTCRFSRQSTQRDNLLDARDAFVQTIWMQLRVGSTEGDLCAG